MSKTQSQPRAEGPWKNRSAFQAEEIESLKELAGLLRTETDRWSRQVILAEAAAKIIELEKQLADSKKRAS